MAAWWSLPITFDLLLATHVAGLCRSVGSLNTIDFVISPYPSDISGHVTFIATSSQWASLSGELTEGHGDVRDFKPPYSFATGRRFFGGKRLLYITTESVCLCSNNYDSDQTEILTDGAFLPIISSPRFQGRQNASFYYSMKDWCQMTWPAFSCGMYSTQTQHVRNANHASYLHKIMLTNIGAVITFPGCVAARGAHRLGLGWVRPEPNPTWKFQVIT